MKEKILYNEERAAKQITVTGWIDINGHFWGKDEHAARYASCTHKLCDCGNEMEKYWTKCSSCRHRDLIRRYYEMPFKEWDGIEPICLIDADEKEYFFSEEELLDWCVTNEREPEGLMLVICTPNYPHSVSGDYWSDSLPEDQSEDDVFSQEALEKLKELNEILKAHKPISYSPGKIRTSYTLKS